MRLTGHLAPRDEAQQLAWDAMEFMYGEPGKAADLCRKALEIYPDCTDALLMLAEIDSKDEYDYLTRIHGAVQAGKRDLGEQFFEENIGHFWSVTEARPFMRAMDILSRCLSASGVAEGIDRSIRIREEMLRLNPNDNQGIRDLLVSDYLLRKRYDDAARLIETYPDDWSAVSQWARVLHAYVVEGEQRAVEVLADARECNPHVERYLSGRKRLGQSGIHAYSPGEEDEAMFCAEILGDAWMEHSDAIKWLKGLAKEDKGRKKTQRRGSEKGKASTAVIDLDDDRDLKALMRGVPKARAERLTALVRLLDAFCDCCLDDEYRELCRKMACVVFRKKSVPVDRGKLDGWASGIVHVIGRVNFLNDPAQRVHMKASDVAEKFGISMSTMQSRAKAIDQVVPAAPFDPKWTLPSMAGESPLVWVLDLGGFMIDMRTAPREMQIAAFELGLIPHVPADRNR